MRYFLLTLVLISGVVIYLGLNRGRDNEKSFVPTNAPKQVTTYQRIAQSRDSVFIYDQPQNRIERIRVIGVLLVPKNVKLSLSSNYRDYHWQSSMLTALSSVGDYWFRTLDQRVSLEIEIWPEPISSDYTVGDFGREISAELEVTSEFGKIGIQAGYNPNRTFTVLMVYQASDEECNQYSQLGFNDYSDCMLKLDKYNTQYAHAWGGIAVMGDIFFTESDNPFDAITSAHEFGHALFIPHPQDDLAINQSGIDFSTQTGNLMGHGIAPLSESFLMPQQRSKMGLP